MEKKKSVLLISGNYFPSYGGVENSLRGISADLQKEGNNVVIVCSNRAAGCSNLPAHETIFSTPVHRYKAKFFLDAFISCLLILKRLNKLYNFDLVISRNNFTTLCCRIAGLKNVKYLAPGVHRFQNKIDISERKSIKSFLSYYLHYFVEWLNLQSLDKVYVFSDEMERQIRRVNKSIVIKKVFPGVDKSRFYFVSQENKNKLKISMGIKKEKKVLLFVARVELVKRPFDSIDILSMLGDEYVLIYVGDGSILPAVKSRAYELGLSDRVYFEGKVSEPEAYYRISDAFLMTSSYEPFGQTILEALSCGLPVFGYESSPEINTATSEIFNRLGALELNDNLVRFHDGPQAIAKLIESRIRKEVRLDLRLSWSSLAKSLTKETA